jgi:CrcB protein
MAISPFVLVLVATGGACGALIRFGCTIAVEHFVAKTSFSFATVVVNIVGCFAAGFLLARFGSTLEGISPHVKALIFTGLLGGFTTYSSFAFQSTEMLITGRPLLAAAYVATTVTAGILAVWAGLRLCS